MASGKQLGAENVDAFDEWVGTQSDEDFAQIINYQGKLTRREIAKGAGIGESSLKQNSTLRKRLKALEDGLRERGVLPPLTAKAKQQVGKPKSYDHTANRRIQDSKRLSTLEQENIELKAKVKELEEFKVKLERYTELSEVLAELGMMPR